MYVCLVVYVVVDVCLFGGLLLLLLSVCLVVYVVVDVCLFGGIFGCLFIWLFVIT